MQKGKVKWFNKKKGIGFIVPESNSQEVFVHYTNIVGEGYKNLEQDDVVEFDLEDTDKGPLAKNIKKI
jgi:CspA family cold shock protein